MATHCVQMKFWGVQNATFDKNLHENERIRIILGFAIIFIGTGWGGGVGVGGAWLVLCFEIKVLSDQWVSARKT